MRYWWILSALLLAPASALRGQSAPAPPPADTGAMPVPAAATAAAAPTGNYALPAPGPPESAAPAATSAGPSVARFPAEAGAVLLPGDVLRLKIWREKDLSGDFPVDERGTVVLPKLGPLQVEGVAVDALRDRIVQEYRRYLRNPSIEVIPLRRVTVLGAVRSPGLYPVDPTMTVADALALAGGVMPEARTDRVEVRRDGRRVQASLRVRTRIADSPVQSGDQLFVPERSWISRNSGVVATLISVTSSLAVALILR